MQSGTVSFSGSVAISDSILTSMTVAGSTASAQLSVSGGTWTGCLIQINSFPATIGGSCLLINSKVTVSGATGRLTATQTEMRSNGQGNLALPLDIQAGGRA